MTPGRKRRPGPGRKPTPKKAKRRVAPKPRAPPASRTGPILREILARELAAKTFYEALLEAVAGTEFERYRDRLQAMVDEEAQHAREVRALMEKYG